MTLPEIKKIFSKNLLSNFSNSEIDLLFGIFAGDILGLSKLAIRSNEERILTSLEEEQFHGVITLLKSGKPYQQIRKRADFYGLKFYINEHVLIPRPETEELVELAIKQINKYIQISNSEPVKILDIGTGSGVIPVALKKVFPKLSLSALDISPEALNVAQHNAQAHKVEIDFKIVDILMEDLMETYHVIISNPPYIAQSENATISESVKNFEPNIALFPPSDNPLVFYERIVQLSKEHLLSGGLIFLEINQKLGADTLALFKNFKHYELIKDLSGNDRFVFAIK